MNTLTAARDRARVWASSPQGDTLKGVVQLVQVLADHYPPA